MKAGLYARISTTDQQTLSMQIETMRKYCRARKWSVVIEIEEIGSGAKKRPERERLLKMARRRELDVIIVWKLDRFGRSAIDVIGALTELNSLGVGFVSITEALDFTTPAGRALAGMLSVFAEMERDLIKERVRAGIASARSKGKPHGRPSLSPIVKEQIQKLVAEKDVTGKRVWNNSDIAKKLGISRTSVIRHLSSSEKAIGSMEFDDINENNDTAD